MTPRTKHARTLDILVKALLALILPLTLMALTAQLPPHARTHIGFLFGKNLMAIVGIAAFTLEAARTAIHFADKYKGVTS